jgi:hypothetical protein
MILFGEQQLKHRSQSLVKPAVGCYHIPIGLQGSHNYLNLGFSDRVDFFFPFTKRLLGRSKKKQ